MSCNWEKPIFKDDLLAVYGCNTGAALCRVLGKGASSPKDVVQKFSELTSNETQHNPTFRLKSE